MCEELAAYKLSPTVKPEPFYPHVLKRDTTSRFEPQDTAYSIIWELVNHKWGLP